MKDELFQQPLRSSFWSNLSSMMSCMMHHRGDSSTNRSTDPGWSINQKQRRQNLPLRRNKKVDNVFFNQDLVDSLSDIINENCKTGDGLKLETLAEKLGESWEAAKVLKPATLDDCVRTCMADTVGIRKGPNGGYYLLAVERSKKTTDGTSTGFSRTYTEEELNAVKTVVEAGLKLNNGKGIQLPFIMGRLDTLEPGYVQGAIAHLAEYEIKRGRGVCRKAPEQPVVAPAPEA